MMRRLLLLACLLAPPAAIQAAPPAQLGEWLEVGDESYLPQVGLTLDVPEKPEPGVYRQIALNWQDRKLQVGAYPPRAFAAKRVGEVGLSLTIEPDGRLAACRVAESSGDSELDDHSCAHLLAHTVYHPGLDDRGNRFGGTISATLRYQLRATVNMPVEGSGGERARPTRPPAPLETITLATLGIAKGSKPPPMVFGIGATLAIDANGRVGACWLHSPTYVDAVDKLACDRLRALAFRPAVDAEGRPAAGEYGFGLPWSR